MLDNNTPSPEQKDWIEKFDKQFPQLENFENAFESVEPDRIELKIFIQKTITQEKQELIDEAIGKLPKIDNLLLNAEGLMDDETRIMKIAEQVRNAYRNEVLQLLDSLKKEL